MKIKNKQKNQSTINNGNVKKQIVDHKTHSQSAKNKSTHHQPNQKQHNNKHKNKVSQTGTPATSSTVSSSIPLTSGSSARLSALQQQFINKLEGARFRTINEELYTTTGSEAFEKFQEDPSKFHIYHSGYRIQATAWPCNPLDYIIEWIQQNHPTSIIADLGCGEARLAASVTNTVHSFDLVAVNERVIACDMASLPLPNHSVDVVVFCLSLMGINLNDFLREAHRILKINGIIKIVEVRSRFEDGKGIKHFLQFLRSTQCFRITPQNNSNNQKGGGGEGGGSESSLLDNIMFFSVECTKISNQGKFSSNFELKPCVYKKR